MKSQILKICALLSLTICVSFVAVINATPAGEKAIDSHMEYDTVEMAIDYKCLDNEGILSTYVPPKTTIGNETISLISRISNLGARCFIRAKIDLNASKNADGIKLNGLNESWVKKADGYWYYTVPLEEDQLIYFFDSITFPNWGNEMQNQEINLNVIYEAVQVRNFEPDFNKDDDCWNDVEIQKTVKSRLLGGTENEK